MTALNAAILFNNSTGSDTTASGSSAGANVYGAGASTTSASAVVTGITTTGVQAGDLLWVQSSSGRQFSVIASVDSGTQVTCDDTFANTESSRTWAIGGKRATLDNADSRNMFRYFKQGWIVELETDQSISSSIIWEQNWSQGSPASILRGDSGQIRTINQTNNTYHFGDSSGFAGRNVVARIENIKFTNSASVKTSASSVFFWWYSNQATFLSFVDCVFGDSTNPIYSFHQGQGVRLQGMMHNCLIDSTISDAIPYISAGDQYNFIVDGCVFKDCNSGITQTNTSVAASIPFVRNCLFTGITNEAIEVQTAPNQGSQQKIHGCVFYNCGTGVKVRAARPLIVHDCIFSSCTTAIDLDNGYFGNGFADLRRNAFYNNATNFSEPTGQDGTHYEEFSLTADPFVDAANGDFNIADSAGGGATLRANNFSLNTDTAVYPFRQYVSDDFGAGGGGAVLHPLRSN